jgi:hypothetical protein
MLWKEFENTTAKKKKADIKHQRTEVILKENVIKTKRRKFPKMFNIIKNL